MNRRIAAYKYLSAKANQIYEQKWGKDTPHKEPVRPGTPVKYTPPSTETLAYMKDIYDIIGTTKRARYSQCPECTQTIVTGMTHCVYCRLEVIWA